MIGEFSGNGISCKTRVKFVGIHWLVLVRFYPSTVSQLKLVIVLCRFLTNIFVYSFML